MDDYIILIIIIVVLLIIVFLLILCNQGEHGEKMDPIPANTFPFQTYIINLDRKPERYQAVKRQLDQLGITDYQRYSAVDGFFISDAVLLDGGAEQVLIDSGRGLAACAVSHRNVWKHIAKHKLDWTLILEDDVHFHPDFMKLFHKYWKETPIRAKIIYPGYLEVAPYSPQVVIRKSVVCLHAYMLNHVGAQYLLDKLAKMDRPIDLVVENHFSYLPGSYIFNSWVNFDGIVANDYKKNNGDKCMFNGIVYQNREEYGRTIYQAETTFNNHF